MAPLSAEELSYLVRHDTFQASMVGALLTGIYTAIILFTVHHMVMERGLKSTLQPLFFPMILMYICATTHLAVHWEINTRAFVRHGQTEEMVHEAIIHPSLAESAVLIITRGIIIFTADCIMIWRCWRLYARSWKVVTVPVGFAVVELVLFIVQTVSNMRHLALDESPATAIILLIAHLSSALGTTVLVTLLIVYRIVQMGGAKHYHDILAIIIESSALYAITIVMFLPFLRLTKVMSIIPSAVLTAMPGIASTLIISRVALGREVERTFDEKDALDLGTSMIPDGRVSTVRSQLATVGVSEEVLSSEATAEKSPESSLEARSDATLRIPSEDDLSRDNSKQEGIKSV